MAVAAKDKAAFRCKNCGHLEDAGSAGENAVPLACSSCGEGVRFDARGRKFAVPENWEVLADATPEVLTGLGLKPDDVAKHEGAEVVKDTPIVGRQIGASLVNEQAQEKEPEPGDYERGQAPPKLKPKPKSR